MWAQNNIVWALLIIFSRYFQIISCDTQCNIPPALWCDNPKISAQCGVSNACATYNKTVFGEKLKITLLYETLCPYCQNFIITELYPDVFKNGSDFVDLELIPYGNAHVNRLSNGTFNFTCQHGPAECACNKLHSCVIHQLKDFQKYMPFVYCMETALHSHDDPTKSAETCLNEANVSSDDQTAINQCYNGHLGVELQLEAAIRTGNIEPQKHDHVPWILVNNVSTATLQGYQGDLFDALCVWYKGPTKPVNCKYPR